MAQPTQLNPTEQDTLVKQIGLALLRAAPPDWEQVVVTFRAVGRYQEVVGEVSTEDGAAATWPVSQDIGSLFNRLRAGMYREGRGTWFNATYQLDRPSSYNLEYDRDEPHWDAPPPPQAYADELRLFPRDEENVPDWLRRRSAGSPAERPDLQDRADRPDRPLPGDRQGGAPDRPAPRFRVARIFDGMGPGGRPVVNRPQLDDMDQDAILDYLDNAPLVGPTRGYDVDRLDPEGRSSVPVAFHTDGSWIWPAAVNYYLRTYGVSPEADLVEHIRRSDFVMFDVEEPVLAAAGAFLNRGGPPPPPPGRQGPPPPGGAGRDAGPPRAPGASPPPPPPPPPTPPTPPPPAHQPPAPQPGAGPTPVPPGSAGMPPPGPVLGHLRAKFAELGVPDSAYRIGPPVERTWTLERTEENWRVGWFEREQFVAPALFEDVADAAAFLLGKVLLDNAPRQEPAAAPPKPAEASGERRAAPAATRTVMVPPALLEDPDEQEPAPDPGGPPTVLAAPPTVLAAPVGDGRGRPVPDRAPAPATTNLAVPPGEPAPASAPPPPHAAPGPRGERAVHHQGGAGGSDPTPSSQMPKPPQDWPIQPLYGEPPLTLFRGKRMIELPEGVEIDRYGEPDGNLTYAVGTPFELRSLVPDWVNKSYHTYRVQQPIEVLTGTAIPWFDQPGGGTAYLLPHAVEDLVEDGYLVEVDGRERPPISG